jgi:signal peptidase I
MTGEPSGTWEDQRVNPEATGPRPTAPSTAPAIGYASPPASAPAKDGSVRNIVEWVVIIAVAVGFAFLVRGYAFQTFFIPSESMVPRLETDDRVLVNKFAYDLRDPSRGDVVVFRTPPNAHISNMDDLVKRIVGMPGETIEGRDGKILINGKVLNEPYLPVGLQSTTFGPAKVPANSYYMLGDNRQYSNDSTHWGAANRDLFVGPVFVTIWPLDRIDVPGWLWGIPIAIGFGTILYLFMRRREPDLDAA